MRIVGMKVLMVGLVTALFCSLGRTQTATEQSTDLKERIELERLAKHATLYRPFELSRRVEDVAPNPQGVIDLSPVVINDYVEPTVPFTAGDELLDLAHRVDAIVQGTAERRRSALTQGRSFVYSDWTIRVQNVIKGTSLVPFKIGDSITVTRSAGETIFNGRRVIARDSSFPDFEVGRRYVLYLIADTNSSSFQAFSGGSFDVTGSNPVPLLDPNNRITKLRSFCASTKIPDFVAEIERSSKQ